MKYRIKYIMEKITSLILFSIDCYYDLIDLIIKSFEEIKLITKYYVLVYDNFDKCIKSTNDKIIFINLANYNYNVNKCYNFIRNESDVWLIWKATYYFNEFKK